MKVDLIVPNSLKEITLKQYQKFIKIQKENDDPYFLQCKMIEIFCNLDSNAVRNLKLSDADKIVNVLNLMFEEKPKLINTFKLGKIEYGFIPKLEDISLGEYVDLDTYMGDWDNMHIAMNVLYRPITEKIKDKYLIEDYNTESKDKLDEIPLDVVLGSVFFFVQFRNGIIDSYAELFGGGGSEQLDAATNFSKKWGWYQSIFGLAQGDITRFENITKLGMHECFMMLSFIKDKNELEAKQIKKNFK